MWKRHSRPDDARASLDPFFAAMDQPTFDGFNTYLVARAARESGLTVVLTGIGGDEVFGGYPSFRLAPVLRRVRRVVPGPIGAIAGAALRQVSPKSSRMRRLAGWLARSDQALPAEYATRQLFGPREIQALTATATEPFNSAPAEASAFNRVAFAEMDVYLRNVLLRDADVMGMAHGLEIREPLLDHELVETVLALGDDVKSRGPGPKPLLAAAVGRELLAAHAATQEAGFQPAAGPVDAGCPAPRGRVGAVRPVGGWTGWRGAGSPGRGVGLAWVPGRAAALDRGVGAVRGQTLGRRPAGSCRVLCV